MITIIELSWIQIFQFSCVNNSASHGVGRLMSRGKVKEMINLEECRNTMKKSVLRKNIAFLDKVNIVVYDIKK